jgi:hypothetical protein
MNNPSGKNFMSLVCILLVLVFSTSYGQEVLRPGIPVSSLRVLESNIAMPAPTLKMNSVACQEALGSLQVPMDIGVLSCFFIQIGASATPRFIFDLAGGMQSSNFRLSSEIGLDEQNLLSQSWRQRRTNRMVTLLYDLNPEDGVLILVNELTPEDAGASAQPETEEVAAPETEETTP